MSQERCHTISGMKISQNRRNEDVPEMKMSQEQRWLLNCRMNVSQSHRNKDVAESHERCFTISGMKILQNLRNEEGAESQD